MSRLGLGVALVLATFGCAQEREPISRVQPNALKKSFFVGENLLAAEDDPEFWYRGTVVDTGFGAQQDGLFTSTYAMPVSRIKWEITETMLVARLSYERVTDTDGKEGTEKGKEGQVVASFPIQTHFDIRRAYNPVTGEEQNVVEENMFDRPWYEREYFRVDWSRNMVTNAYEVDTLSMIGVYGGVQYEPMQYYVNDPTSPDAPVFDDGYFDVTQKVYATPKKVTFSPYMASLFGLSSFPACMLDADFSGGTSPTGNCNPHELKLRLSFRKVVDTDYEAQDWDGVRFQAFGAFTLNFSGRNGYTRPYGIVDQKTHRFIERYNIWQKSHYYRADGSAVVCGTLETEGPSKVDSDGNGTIDACEEVAQATGLSGSRCDVYAKKCTLPFRARQDRSIVWYYHDGPTDEFQKSVGDNKLFDSANGDPKFGLFEPTDWATMEWDVAMRSARTTARLVECKRTGDAGACEAQFPMWHGQMDDQEDAMRLTREVLLCRRANAVASGGKSWVDNSCDAVADQKASAMGITDPGVISISKQSPAVILCHNPVIDSDHPDCHAPFKPGQEKRVRLGDLRYNAVNTINTPQTPSAWGIMVDATDPTTGETIASSINIWNHVTDMASQGAIDIVRYINGEISTKEITDGKFIQDWVLANEGIAGGSRISGAISKEEALQRVAALAKDLDPDTLAEGFESHLQGKNSAFLAKTNVSLKKHNLMVRDVKATSSIKDSSNAAVIQGRMERARGTEFEAQLINKPALEATGISEDSLAQADPGLVADLASPLRMGNQMVISRIREARQQALAARGACIMEATPEFSGMIGMAKILNDKFPVVDGESPQVRAEKMRRYFARRLQYNVLLHEMGHSFSLRHNFLSSYDGIGFRPQYWQLRTRNGTVSAPCTQAQNEEGANNCVGPRYFDPVTQEETDGLIWMWQQSSVMDYAGDLSVDTMNLGAYDFAATRMFYGESTSVFGGNSEISGNDVNAGWVLDDDKDGVANKVEELLGTNPQDPKSRPSKALLTQNDQKIKEASGIISDYADRMDSFGGILGLKTGSEHYSRYQAKYNLIRPDTCAEVDPNSYRPSDWNESIDGAFHPTMDAHVVAVNGAYTRCRQQPVDYSNWSDLRPVFSETDVNAIQGDNPPAADPQGRLRVPYPFASDGWADTGNVSVYRHDQGADQYELFMFLLGSQENRHIFDNYRRNRTTFAIRPAMSRSFGRYTQKVMRAVKGLGLYNNLYEMLGFGGQWKSLMASTYAENSIAASMAMDHFARQLARPQDGEHYLLQQSDGSELLMASDGAFLTPFAAVPHITIPNGTSGYKQNGFTALGFGGRPVNNSLDRTKGDYASSYQLAVGSYYDKINVVMALTESQDNFISSSRNDFVDARYRAASIADVFSDGFRRLIGAALADDKAALGPRVAGAKSQFPNYTTSTDAIDKADANIKACDKADSQCVIGEDGVSAFPKQPMAWVSWWPSAGPKACWTTNGSQVCQTFGGNSNGFANGVPPESLVVDPEIGWEIQKYIIAWTYLYLPENSRTDWFDMLRIFRGYDLPDILGAKVQWRDPFTGLTYVARSYGKETVNGRLVEKGIGARVLERANELTEKAFENNGRDPVTGEVQLKLDSSGNPILIGGSDCGSVSVCIDLKRYKSVPDFMWQAGYAYGLSEGQTPKGIWLEHAAPSPPRRGHPAPARPAPRASGLFGLSSATAAGPSPPGRAPAPGRPPASGDPGRSWTPPAPPAGALASSAPAAPG
jgi:hypothetical protein